jgi:hypothetical protein
VVRFWPMVRFDAPTMSSTWLHRLKAEKDDSVSSFAGSKLHDDDDLFLTQKQQEGGVVNVLYYDQ